MRLRWHWLGFAALLAAEFHLFDRMTSAHHAWVYPRWNDQIQYLTEAYTAYEQAQTDGVVPALAGTLTNASAQGTLHDFWALLVFLVAGPSRSAALSVNLLAFVAWQAALFWAVLRSGAPRPAAWLAALLPLALRGPWAAVPGGAIDFRLDHLALCMLGVTSAAALATDGFRQRRASLLLGLAVGLTLITRFLTGTYFAVLFGLALLWLARGPERAIRLRNLLAAAAVAAAVAAPVFWVNRDWVWNYYFIGHFVGPESALRAPNFGLGRSLAFVLGHWQRDHLGLAFWLIPGAAAGALALLAPLRRAAVPAASHFRPGEWAGVGAAFLFAPLLVLTLHTQKSEVVLSSLTPGLVLALAAGLTTLVTRTPAGWRPTLVAVLAGAAACTHFARAQGQTPYDAGFVAEARAVNTVADQIYASARRAGLGRPHLGVDHVTDALDAQILRVICYERHRRWVPFDMKLPTGIMTESEAVLLARLQDCDFFFLTDPPAGDGRWPYDRDMRRLHPALKQWCEHHLKPVRTLQLAERSLTLYQRREIE